MYCWKIDTGQVYGAAERSFVDVAPEGADIVTLYSDTSDPANMVVADKAYLRKTVLFYGYDLGDELKNRLDKIQSIQAEYAPILTELQEAKNSADLRDDAEDAAAIKAEYQAALEEMRQKIQEVPGD